MNKEQIFKVIKANRWIEEETPASNCSVDLFKTCYLDVSKIYRQKIFSSCAYYISDNYLYEWSREDETKVAYDLVREKSISDKRYFSYAMEKFAGVSREIDILFRKFRDSSLSGFSASRLNTVLKNIIKMSRQMLGYSIITEALDCLSEADYISYLKNVPSTAFQSVLHTLATIENLSFGERERLDLLNCALLAIDEDSFKEAAVKNQVVLADFSRLAEAIKKHTDNFFWIQSGYKKAVYLNEEHFLALIVDLVSQKTKEEIEVERNELQHKKTAVQKDVMAIEKKYQLGPEDRAFFQLIRDFSFWQDRRKENILKLIFCIDKIINEVERKFNIPKKELYYFLVDDFSALLSSGKRLSAKDINKRKKILLFSYLKDNHIKTEILYGEEADRAKKMFQAKIHQESFIKELRGFVASTGNVGGIISGKARIVFNPESEDFQKGEILVVGMTRPEYVHLMKKARAIITNEGGITSHAAIISRELKVPCIIGTKTATGKLKTGDLVEMDLEKGIIKIINDVK